MLWPDPRNGPWEVAVQWAMVNERWECVGLEVRPQPGSDPQRLTAALLKEQLALGRLLSEVRGELAPEDRARHRPRRGQVLPADHLDQVASVYRRAWSTGDPAPNKAVAQYFTVDRSTASKYVLKARRAGLLPPTKPGVADGAVVAPRAAGRGRSHATAKGTVLKAGRSPAKSAKRRK